MRFRSRRNLGLELADLSGWKHKDLIERLEESRVAKSAAFYESKKAATAKREAAAKSVDTSAFDAVLKETGYSM